MTDDDDDDDDDAGPRVARHLAVRLTGRCEYLLCEVRPPPRAPAQGVAGPQPAAVFLQDHDASFPRS